MSRELQSGSITNTEGEEIEFWFYPERTVSQHMDIEKMVEKHGGTQTALLMSAFMVCALDADGKRLFPAASFTVMAGKLAHSELVDACLLMGGIEAAPDPKA